MNEKALRLRIKELLYSQLYGVLCTRPHDSGLHASIVAFASADDLSAIIFATPRNTRKYQNMLSDSRIAIFFDDRRPRKEDLMKVTGLEAQGSVRELTKQERGGYRAVYLARHPDMAEFVDATGSALMRLEVEQFEIVDHFQHLLILRLDKQTKNRGEQT